VRVLFVFALASVCASLASAAAPSGSGLHRLTTWAGEQIQPSWGR
jgi:hypothetical protein